jgi:cobalt/nickel transport protein
MKRFQNLILLALAIVLTVAPLVMIKKPEPGPDGKEVEIFAGADDQAKDAIGKINPSYKPWASSLLEPPSGEVASLLFSLQAALGAGFIGYWYGCSSTRARLRREQGERA